MSLSPTTIRETTLLAGLAAGVCVLAAAMAWFGQASWLEASSFVTGALCVWLTVRQNIWNFPIGLVNVVTYCVVFFQSRLFADAGLQIAYFFLGVTGWWIWLRGDGQHRDLKVSRAPPVEVAVLLTMVVASTISLWQSLSYLGGSASFWDALTTSLSLASQWLLNRKRLESWIGWIIVDVIYVPLYVYKELYLTAILYTVFLVLAVVGFKAWRESWREGMAKMERR